MGFFAVTELKRSLSYASKMKTQIQLSYAYQRFHAHIPNLNSPMHSSTKELYQDEYGFLLTESKDFSHKGLRFKQISCCMHSHKY